MIKQKEIKKMMIQARKMQQDLVGAQTQLENEVVDASSGGGKIKVKMNCKSQIVSISIHEEMIDKDDIEQLEDLLVIALNKAQNEVLKTSEKKLEKLTGGMSIPTLEK